MCGKNKRTPSIKNTNTATSHTENPHYNFHYPTFNLFDAKHLQGLIETQELDPTTFLQQVTTAIGPAKAKNLDNRQSDTEPVTPYQGEDAGRGNEQIQKLPSKDMP